MNQREQAAPSLDLVFNEVKERISVQLGQIEALDHKAGTLLGLSSVVITIAAGLRFVEGEGASKVAFLTLFSLGALFYAITIFFAFRGYWVVEYRRDPEPRPLRDFYLSQEEELTKRRLLSNMIASYEFNVPLLRNKAYNIRMAARFLFVETVLLALALTTERAIT
ncbi:MAG: hypothetical protein ACE5IZ_05665 [Dehalococcoidia bacterium]